VSALLSELGPPRGGGNGGDSAPIAWHLLPDSAAVAGDGGLLLGGLSVVELAEEFGTPLFLYDEDHLRTRAREAVRSFPDGASYATKAFLSKAMARLVFEEGMTLDVASGGELGVVLAAGVPAGRVVLHGNNKSTEELEAALRAGVGRIVVDSFDEIDRLRDLGRGPRATRVLLRVNPGVEAATHRSILTGQEDSKFGFGLRSGAAARAAGLLGDLPGVELVGVHSHLGSQILDLASFCEVAEAVVPFAVELGVDELCLGGGLGVAYLGSEHAPTIPEWGAAVRKACREAGLPASVKILAEPGRSIVAAAAITVYRVGTLKEIPGVRTYLAVDGGMSDNPRPALYDSSYEVFLPATVTATRPRVVRVVGKHCESGDVLVPAAHVPADVRVGDLLATPVSGAYGYSMASNYNKLTRPAVVFVRAGQARLVLRRETVSDLLRLDLC